MLQRLIPALVTVGLFASPALAQTTGQNSQTVNRSMSGHNSGTNTASGTSSQDPAQVEQHIRQDLSKAGYTDVRVIPGSFLVQAKDSQGNPTQMMITPGGVTEVTALRNGGSNQANSGNGMNGNSGSKQ